MLWQECFSVPNLNQNVAMEPVFIPFESEVAKTKGFSPTSTSYIFFLQRTTIIHVGLVREASRHITALIPLFLEIKPLVTIVIRGVLVN